MKRGCRIVVLSLLIFFLHGFCALAADRGDFSTKPVKNNGKKWRIAYYEGGEYTNYQLNMLGMLKGLMDLGWMESTEIPHQKGEQTKQLWNWLADNVKSEYIDFVRDAHYSGNWDDKLIEKMVPRIIDRLNNKKDIDLIIAAGTKAGQNLANERHSVPTLVISTTNPLSAGIIKSIEDSGYDHVHARIDPYRHEQQVRIFHDIIGFKKLGIVYENTENGRNDAALDKVEKVAKERGFEIVRCFSLGEDATRDENKAAESVKKCFHELGKKADALYVTHQIGINNKSIPELVKIANSYRLPTFSQSHSEQVKYGFLMSISRANFEYVGRFYAETAAKIFNRAKPRQLDQVFEGPPKIAINIKTAEIIGYDPPVDVLGAADEIFQEITTPSE